MPIKRPSRVSYNQEPKLIKDLSRSGEALARAVKAAREGAGGVSYEEWIIRMKIDEALAEVGMQVISKLT